MCVCVCGFMGQSFDKRIAILPVNFWALHGTRNFLPLIPILSQLNHVHMHIINLFKICFIIIIIIIMLPSTPIPLKWSLPLRFSTTTLHDYLFSPIRATCPIHLIFLHCITKIIFYEVTVGILWSVPTRRTCSSPASSFFLLNNLLETLFFALLPLSDIRWDTKFHALKEQPFRLLFS